MQSQPFVYPDNLFDDGSPSSRKWTCARTRPRWEKRFANWLRTNNVAYFLPVTCKCSRSHRKTRVTELPLFPGYVFVRGDHTKGSFTRAAAVAYVITPRSEQEFRDVDETLTDVWRVLSSGQPYGPVNEIQAGEAVEVVAGPLMGTRGRFLRQGDGGQIVVWIDLFGVGVSAEIGDASFVEPVK